MIPSFFFDKIFKNFPKTLDFSFYIVYTIYNKARGNTPKELKMYEVWKINEKGIYELVERVENGKIAGAIKKAMIARGIWAQIKKI